MTFEFQGINCVLIYVFGSNFFFCVEIVQEINKVYFPFIIFFPEIHNFFKVILTNQGAFIAVFQDGIFR